MKFGPMWGFSVRATVAKSGNGNEKELAGDPKSVYYEILN